MAGRREFESKEVVRLTRIPYQTLDRWITEGYLTCELPAEGTGSRRRFSFRDVVLAKVAVALKEHRLPLPAMKGMLAAIRQNWRDEDPAHAGYLAVRIWRDATMAIWWEDPGRLGEMIEALAQSGITRGEGEAPWTGVTVLVDVAYLARKAQEEIDSQLR